MQGTNKFTDIMFEFEIYNASYLESTAFITNTVQA